MLRSFADSPVNTATALNATALATTSALSLEFVESSFRFVNGLEGANPFEPSPMLDAFSLSPHNLIDPGNFMSFSAEGHGFWIHQQVTRPPAE